MKIMIVTDAWEPQVNGVVRTLKNTTRELTALGHRVDLLTPLEFKTIPCPTYPEIRLSLLPRRKLRERIDAFAPDALHIATEGPLGMAARAYALRHKLPFTTAYHTRFPEYVQARFGMPLAVTYKFLHWFHKRVAGRDGAHAGGQARPRKVRLHECRAVDSRRRSGDLSPDGLEGAQHRAADLSVRRTRGGREERRGVSEARSARLEVGRRRRPGARRTEVALSAA